MRDGDADRVFDLSVDHKPESAAEIERIDRHYKALLGQDSWMTREEAEVMEMQEGDSWQPEDYVVESGVDLSVHSAASGGGRRGSNNFSQDGSAGGSVVRVCSVRLLCIRSTLIKKRGGSPRVAHRTRAMFHTYTFRKWWREA